MRTQLFTGILALTVLACGAQPGAPAPELAEFDTPAPQPRIDSVWPDHVSSGHLVTIQGSNFDPSRAEVWIDDDSVTIESGDSQHLVVSGVPAVNSPRSATFRVVQPEDAISNDFEVTRVPRGHIRTQDVQAPTEPRYTVAAADGTIYFTDASGLFQVDTDGSVRRLAGEAQGLGSPEGLAWSSDGRLAVVNRGLATAAGGGTVAGNGKLFLLDPATRALEILAIGLTDPTALASGADDNFYVLEGGNNRVRRVSSAGIVHDFATLSAAPYGSDLAVLGDYVYLSSSATNRIDRVSTAGGSFTSFVGYAEYPQGLTVADGHLYTSGYFPTYGGLGVAEVDITSASLAPAALFNSDPPFSSPRDVAATDTGAFVVTDGGQQSVIEVSGTQARPRAQGLSSAVGMVSMGQHTYAATAPSCNLSRATDSLVEIAIDGSTRIVAPIYCPEALAASPGGQLLAVEYDANYYSQVVAVEPDSGERSVRVPGNVDLEPMFMGIATDSTGAIYVSDADMNRVFKYDEAGTQLAVTTIPQATGLGAIVAAGDLLYMADDSARVIRVPLTLDETKATVVADSQSLSAVKSLATGRDGSVVVADPDAQKLIQIDLHDQVSDLVTFDNESPAATTVDWTGTIITLDAQAGRLFQVAP